VRAAVALILVTAWCLRGQEFEVASVKLHPATSGNVNGSPERSGSEETGDRVSIENLPLRVLIEIAYGVRDFQLAGPGWLSSICVDIEAKPPAGYKHDQLPVLLRNLLADRFKLAVHHGSKQTSAYALLSVKGAQKLHEAAGPRGFFTARPGLISGTRVSMGEFTGALADMLERPVVDKTGLTAVYDLKLEWTPGLTAEASEPGLSLFTALRDQLGLSLRTQKVSVDVVIVDRVEKAPTDN
jgi:uncharacterized protein (TIGR03435 family)